jgi:hypothetical protein
MTMDPWYYLTCPACRARLRIKADYTHMRGRCPSCHVRIEPPIPKPLKINLNDPGGLVPEDDQWPEPATLMEETSARPEPTYDVSSSTAAPTKPEAEEEEEQGGVYTLSFDPNEPATPGISRTAEWDQGPVPASETAAKGTDQAASDVPRETPPVSATPGGPPPAAPVSATPAVVYESVVDPLFGDVVQVATPVESAPPAPPAASTKAIPVARLAVPTEVAPPPIPKPLETAKIPPVEPLQDAPPKKRRKLRPSVEKELGASALDDVDITSELDKPTDARHLYRLSVAEENRIKPDPPPKNLFFDGVFNFPWTPGNRAVWVWLSIGFAMLLVCGYLMIILLEMGNLGAAGVLGVSLAGMWIFVWTCSYGCAGMLNTITYTAASSNAVSWPDDGWKEWFPSLLKVGYYAILAMAMGSLAQLIGLTTIGWLAITLFLFPLFLFSGMASLSFWNFLNGDIFQAVFKKLPEYLLFYGLSFVLWIIAGGLCIIAVGYTFLVIPIAGPVVAAAWMIYSRLLGRMAYALQEEPRKKRRRKKKKAEDAEDEEEMPVDDGIPVAQPEEQPIRMAEVKE